MHLSVFFRFRRIHLSGIYTGERENQLSRIGKERLKTRNEEKFRVEKGSFERIFQKKRKKNHPLHNKDGRDRVIWT